MTLRFHAFRWERLVAAASWDNFYLVTKESLPVDAPLTRPYTKRQKRQGTRQQKLSRRESYATPRLIEWQAEAQRRSQFLRAEEVWSMVEEFAEEAAVLDLTAELRDVCLVAAGQMMDPRCLRLTARYGRRDDEI